MSWLARAAKPHRCVLPKITDTERVETGDVWRCDACGICHGVTVIDVGHDREPGEPARTFTWERLGRTRDTSGVWSG